MALKFKNLFRKDKEEKKLNQETRQYYDRTAIDATGANWRLIVGQRSNGKSYSICKTIVENYINEKKRAAYIRRYDEEIKPKNIQTLFDPHLPLILELSQGRFNGVFYRSNCFWLCYYNDEGKIEYKDDEPFCITRAVNTWETTKGADVGVISLICYDEFLTRSGYLRDEFICFMNLCSSLIRDRKDCVIYLLANSVNKYAPYWQEFGIDEVDKMEQGEIRVYTYPNSQMKLAIEYCATAGSTKQVNDSFFAFENAQLEMLKNGSWEMASYQHAPYKILDEMVKKVFYVKFNDQLICGKIIHYKQDLFIFFHRQTKDIEIDDKTPLYSASFSTAICHVRYLNDCPTDLHKWIRQLILKNHICFADNEVGEIIRNWLVEQGLSIL